MLFAPFPPWPWLPFGAASPAVPSARSSCVWETPQDQLQQQQRCHQGMAAPKNGLAGVFHAVHEQCFECQNLHRERQGHCRYTWQGASHCPWASLLLRAASGRGVGEQSTENGSMQQVGGLVGTWRGHKHPESAAGEPSMLLPSPRGKAEGLLQILQASPLQERAGLCVCGGTGNPEPPYLPLSGVLF